MLSTSQLRRVWGPPCRGFQKVTIGLYGTGRVLVDVRIKNAVYELNRCLARHRYPSIYIQTGAFNCRLITDGNDYSLHAYGIAIDLNWLLNGRGYHASHNLPQALVNDILAIRTNSGAQVWGWGGNYTAAPPDYMHFEIVASPADIATGIRTSTLTDDGELTMDAEAKAAFAAQNAKLDKLVQGLLLLTARVDEIDRLHGATTAYRVRKLAEKAGIQGDGN